MTPGRSSPLLASFVLLRYRPVGDGMNVVTVLELRMEVGSSIALFLGFSYPSALQPVCRCACVRL